MSTAAHRKGDPTITVDPNVRDYNKTPFAIKKAERARAFIQKHGLPKKEGKKK